MMPEVEIVYRWNCPRCGFELESALEPDGEFLCRWCAEGKPKPVFASNALCDIVNCQPDELVRRVSALVNGYPSDEPPDSDREVLCRYTVNKMDVFVIGWYDGEWRPRVEVRRWWELSR